MNVITNISTWMKWAHTVKTKGIKKNEHAVCTKQENAHILPQWREKYEFPVIEFKHPIFIYVKQVWTLNTYTHTHAWTVQSWYERRKNGHKRAAHFDRLIQPIDHRTHYQIDAWDRFQYIFSFSNAHSLLRYTWNGFARKDKQSIIKRNYSPTSK